jgi:hypothetical protein
MGQPIDANAFQMVHADIFAAKREARSSYRFRCPT